MTANGWWRGSLAGALVGSSGLAGVAAAPLLVGAGVTAAAVPLVCVRQIEAGDWGAYGLSVVILALLVASLGGALAGLLHQVRRTQQAVAYLRLFTRPLDRRLRRRLTRMGLAERVDLVDLDTPLAFCYGLLRPRILVSSGVVAALAPDELAALLWHEQYHLTRRDPLKVALGRAGALAFCYLPAVRACFDRYLVEKEVEADAYVCSRQGGDAALVNALATLLDRDAGAPLLGDAVAVAGAAEVLDARIGRLLGITAPPPLPWRAVVLSGMVVIGVLALEVVFLLSGSPLGLRHIPAQILTSC